MQFLKHTKLIETGLGQIEPESDAGKRILITNRIALIAIAVLVGAFIMVVSVYHIFGIRYSILNTLRPLFAGLAVIMTLILNGLHLHKAAKFNLIFAVLFFMVYFPLFIGKGNGELLIVNTFTLLSLSVIAHMIISLRKEKFLYRLVISMLLAHLIIFDLILLKFAQTDQAFFAVIERFIYTYSVFKITTFAFINVVLYYVWSLNHKIQDRMIAVQNDLIEINYEVTQQSTKMREYQEELRAQNSELHAQNEQIAMQRDFTKELSETLAEKNQQLTESIHYAKNIQDAVFPQNKLFKTLAEDCFIIFRPRDVISGDFKWSGKLDNKLVIAAADCTGHGIPGALLSILGVTLLNEIVLKDCCTEANEVLNRLRERMIESLSQNPGEEGFGDGMDISLCVFDFDDNSLMYAGANSPLLLIRNFEMTEYKPDRMPVGIYETDKVPFSAQRIEFTKGDRFYLFTDGYRDQFGGSKSKKLKKKVFKDILLSTSGNRLSDQKGIVEHFFDDWKGANEQVDDVLLIGIEI